MYSQIILKTFFSDNNYILFIIKLSFLVCTFEISFFLNALFYSEDYISNAYHNNGVLDFVSGLPKTIYSVKTTLVLTTLLKLLSDNKKELRKIIKERLKNKEYINLVNKNLKKMEYKIIGYFLLIFSLGFWFLYYVSAFWAVYRNSQKYWFYGCLESFAMNFLISFIICIFFAFFRFLSIKKKNKFLFLLAKIFGLFL